MMKYKIKLSRLSGLSDTDQKEALKALVDAARVKTNGGVSALNARVKKFEIRYEMSSEELKRKCAEGKIRETAEIAKWLFLLNTRDAVTSKQAQP